jgi:hypothetical protein
LISKIGVGWNNKLGTISVSDEWWKKKKLRLVIDNLFVWIHLCEVLVLKLFNIFHMVYAFDVFYFYYIGN